MDLFRKGNSFFFSTTIHILIFALSAFALQQPSALTLRNIGVAYKTRAAIMSALRHALQACKYTDGVSAASTSPAHLLWMSLMCHPCKILCGHLTSRFLPLRCVRELRGRGILLE